MPVLSKATDLDLLQCGLVSIDEIEHEGPVLDPLGCWTIREDGSLGPEHDWSKTMNDIEDEPPYQHCRDCGSLRRSPWKPD